MRFSFDDVVLDTLDATLIRAGQRLPLRGKAFDVLRVLLENGGRLVTRAELIDAVWRGAAIHEQGLSVCVKEIRLVLADDARSPRYVLTEHRRGYRFLATVTRDAPTTSHDATITHDEGVRAGARPGLAFVWSKGQSRSEDCGSRNGSWVDGHALVGTARDAAAGAIVRAGDTLFVLVDDLTAPTVASAHRTRCAELASAAAGHELRGSFVERALLDRCERSAAVWKELVRRACLDAGGGAVTADVWPVTPS